MYGAVRAVEPLHVVRPVARADVGDGRGEVRHLERRRSDVALADRDRQRLAREPRLLEDTPLPRRVRDGARLLMIERDAGLLAEAEAARVARQRIDPEPRADRVEERVARLDDRL